MLFKHTTLKLNDEGVMVEVPKKSFNTLDEAIIACKKVNSFPDIKEKVVSYKCQTCYKYHIGRNGKQLKEKEKEKYIEEIKPRFKIIGRIKL